MGVTQALYTGVTGLGVNADGMSVIANNIANANAKGFKFDRAEFEDLLSQDLSGSGQIGRGSRLANVRTIHTQGGLAVTERLTDMAIQGNGFFIVSNPNTEIQESGGQFFTRVGSFNFDKDGYIADSSGGRLKGYMADKNGRVSTKLTEMRIEKANVPPQATKKINLAVNLDARTEITEGEFDVLQPEDTSDFNNTVNVFDSHGRAHQVTVYYKRIEGGDEGVKWEWNAVAPSADVVDGDPKESEFFQFGKGTIEFDSNGLLLAEETEYNTINFAQGAKAEQVIEFDFGVNTGEEGGNGVGASSSQSSGSITTFHNQDGYTSGNLKSLKIELDGTLRGFYTNGLQRSLGSLAIASFENMDGLQKAGRNQFYATHDSGPPSIGRPQTGVRGSIYSSTLEESNVDLAKQFVNDYDTERFSGEL